MAILVLDLGSSSLKAALVGRDGVPTARRAAGYPTHAPGPGRQEQDPEDWWRALRGAVRDLLARAPAPEAVALTGSMQNLIPVDAEGAAVGPAILYSDGRIGPDRLAALRARLPEDHEARIGNAADAAQTVFRIMDAAERGAMAGARGVHIGAKDWAAQRLTGARVTDPTTATTTGLMNLARGDWDGAILEAAGVAPGLLPRILPGDAAAGGVSASAARDTGLPEGLPVIVGAGDAGASLWGVGAEGPGARSAYLGTSGWVAASVPRPPAPRPHYTLAAPTGDLAVAVAPILTAGGALDWVAARLGLPVEALAEAAERADPDRAPLFLPYLLGERSPFEDRRVRGAFLGLDAGHGAGALALAALEGVAHAIRHAAEGLEARGPVTVTGGAAEAAVMRRVLARVLDAPVRRAAHPRLATALGAARLGWRALGVDAPALVDAEVERPAPAARARAAARYRAHVEASSMARRLAALLGPEREGS